jgi:hypothetical protein
MQPHTCFILWKYSRMGSINFRFSLPGMPSALSIIFGSRISGDLSTYAPDIFNLAQSAAGKLASQVAKCGEGDDEGGNDGIVAGCKCDGESGGGLCAAAGPTGGCRSIGCSKARDEGGSCYSDCGKERGAWHSSLGSPMGRVCGNISAAGDVVCRSRAGC